MKYDVICPGCKGRFHETTEAYDKDKASNGSMFVLKEKYGPKGFNWSTFPCNDSMQSGDLECPSCGAPYCGGGFKVAIDDSEIPKIENDAHVCPECGKVCKSKAGLMAHMRKHE